MRIALVIVLTCVSLWLPQVTDDTTAACCPDPHLLPPQSRDGTVEAATFDTPSAATFDRANHRWLIVDSAANLVRALNESGEVSTIAGRCDRNLANNLCVGSTIDGQGKTARFAGPTLVATSQGGGAYIYDAETSSIRLISADGMVGTLGAVDGLHALASDGENAYATKSGSVVRIERLGPSLASFAVCCADTATGQKLHVDALALGSPNTEDYVSVDHKLIYKMEIGSSKAARIAGSEVGTRSRDGVGSGAIFQHIDGLAVNPSSHDLYIADDGALRRMTVEGEVTTLLPACSGQPGIGKNDRSQCGNLSGLAYGSGTLLLIEAPFVALYDIGGSRLRYVVGHVRKRYRSKSDWSGEYLEPLTGLTIDAYVHGDDEVEVASVAGQVYDVRHGRRDVLPDPYEFHNAASLVRSGAARAERPLMEYLAAMHCGSLVKSGTVNPRSHYADPSPFTETLSMSWYGTFNGAAIYSVGQGCVEIYAQDADKLLYFDRERWQI